MIHKIQYDRKYCKFGQMCCDALVPNITVVHKHAKRFWALSSILDRKGTCRRCAKWGKTGRNWCWIGDKFKKITGLTCTAFLCCHKMQQNYCIYIHMRQPVVYNLCDTNRAAVLDFLSKTLRGLTALRNIFIIYRVQNCLSN